MLMRSEPLSSMNIDLPRAVDELNATWAAAFAGLGWPARLELLEQIDLQLQMRYKEAAVYQEISRAFTAHLIAQLPVSRVECIEQAYFFLNSARIADRQAAQVWLIINKFDRNVVGSEMSSRPQPGAEKRTARRIAVDMPGFIAANNLSIEAKVVDVSRGGARVAIARTLAKGTRVVLDLPMLGRVAAYVVWVASSFVGLAFVS